MGENYYSDIVDHNFRRSHIIVYDEEADGVILVDNNGFVLGTKEIDKLIEGLSKFKNYYSEETLTSLNTRNNNEERISKSIFKQIDHKPGTIFIYRELGTNLYRIGYTSDIENRIKNLENSSPTTIDIVAKLYSKSSKLLKEHLTNVYADKHSHNNWYELDKNDIEYLRKRLYQSEFEKSLSEKNNKVIDSIVCDACKKGVTNLDQTYYFQCMLCQKTFCSDECAYTINHVCNPL